MTTDILFIGGKERINYAINGSFELADANGYPVGWSNGATNLICESLLADLTPNFQGRSGVRVLRSTGANTTETSQIVISDLPLNTDLFISIETYNAVSASCYATIGVTPAGGSTTNVNAPTGIGQHTLSMTINSGSQGSITVVLTANSTLGSARVYFDSLLVTIGEGDYFDGDSPLSRWLAAPHFSPSLLDADAPYSGNQSSYRNDMGLILNNISGFGNPDLQLDEEIDANGTRRINNSYTNNRATTIIGTVATNLRSDYYKARAKLLEAVYPSSVSKLRILRFYDENISLDLPVYYSNGLEGGNVGTTNIEKVNTQFISSSPYPYLSKNYTHLLQRNNTLNTNYIIQGVLDDFGSQQIGWKAFAYTGLPSKPTVITRLANGVILAVVIVGGGPATALYANTAASNNWQKVADMNNNVTVIKPYKDRCLMAGNFTSITPNGGGAVAVNNFISFSIAVGANTIANITNYNTNNIVYDVDVAPDGYIYACGNFTTVSGQNRNYMVKLLLNNSYAISSNLLIDSTNPTATTFTDMKTIRAVGNNVYVGGNFLDYKSDSTLDYLIMYDVNLKTWVRITTTKPILDLSHIPAGIQIERGQYGDVYTYMEDLTANTYYVARIGTKGQTILGPSGRQSVFNTPRMYYSNNLQGLLVAGNLSVTYNGSTYNYVDALWLWKNNDSISRIEISGVTIDTIFGSQNNIFLLHYMASGTYNAGITTELDIKGNCDAKPWFNIIGHGIIHSIENVTTGRKITIEYPISPNEVVTIDTRPESLGIRSSFYGNINKYLSPNSDLQSFTVTEGNNIIRVWAEQYTQLTIYPICLTMHYKPTFVSFDAASNLLEVL